jgi:hypothetical protein
VGSLVVQPSSIPRLRLEPPHPIAVRVAPPPPSQAQLTLIAERSDRMHPLVAGMIAGVLAGPAMVAAITWKFDLVAAVGGEVNAYGGAVAGGIVLGSIFGLLTRHLRKFFPLLLWSLVFFPCALTGARAFVIPRVAPWLVVPPEALLAGGAALGAVLSIQVLLRVRRRKEAW